MKIRNGFISNSSSTSFTFCVKTDNIQDLTDLIKKYSYYFDITGETYGYGNTEFYTVDASQVAEAIYNVYDPNSNNSYEHAIIVSIDREIANVNRSIEDYIKLLAEGSKYKYFKLALKEYRQMLNKLQKAKNDGFKYLIKIQFGDNHGPVCGTPLSIVMDYEGRDININEPDLIVFTKQER